MVAVVGLGGERTIVRCIGKTKHEAEMAVFLGSGARQAGR